MNEDKIKRIKKLSNNLIGIFNRRTFDDLSIISPIGYQDSIELENKIIMTTLIHDSIHKGIYECTKIKDNIYNVNVVSNVKGLQTLIINITYHSSKDYIVHYNNGKTFTEFLNID